MLQVTHSPFLQALGFAIINSLWQFAILWLGFVLINTIFKLSSHQKYCAGFVLQTAGFVWFATTLIFYFRKYVSSYQESSLLAQSSSAYHADSNAATVAEKLSSYMIQAEKLLPYLSVAYIILLVFIVWKWLQAYWFTQAVRTKGLRKIEVTWRLFVQRLSLHLNIKTEVKIYLSELVTCPLTIGFFKPIILIPLASINHLNTEQMEAVILHELAHIKRFDYLFNLFLALIETALFFNPFMQLISRNIKRERENCCDDWVLQFDYNAASYASALLQIATSHFTAPAFALKAADDKQVLLNRIKRMIEKKEKTFFNYRYQLLALFVLTTVVSSLALLSPAHKVSDTAYVTIYQKEVSKPVAARVNTEIYSPFYHAFRDTVIEEKEEKQQRENLQQSLEDLRYRMNINSGKEYNNNDSAMAYDEPKAPLPPAEDYVSSFENNVNVAATEAQKNLEVDNENVNRINFLRSDINTNSELAAAEKKIRKLAAVLLKVKNSSLSKEQFISQNQAALDQLTSLKIQLELTKPDVLTDDQIRETEKAHVISILSNPAILKPVLLRLLRVQINKEIEKVKQQTISFSNSDSNFNFTFMPPDPFVTVPARPNIPGFSYEVSSRSRTKNSPSLINGRLNANRQNKLIMSPQEDNNVILEKADFPAPGKAMKFELKVKNPRTIRI